VAAAATAAAGTDAPFGLYVWAATDPEVERARALERQVFFETFGNTPEMLAAEYEPYDPASTFLAVVDHERGIVAGVVRLIGPSPAGFKSLEDLRSGWNRDPDDVLRGSGVDLDPAETFDIATLAVAPDYRGAATGGLISLALYHGICRLSLDLRIRWAVAILDLVVLDLIQTRTGRPFSHYSGIEPLRYLDSPASLPVFTDMHDYKERLAFLDPAMHGILFEGVGIEAALSTPWSRSAGGEAVTKSA
jgi:hypothetical protein